MYFLFLSLLTAVNTNKNLFQQLLSSFFSLFSPFIIHRCKNGHPAANETCPSNDAQMCHSCLTSFTLSSDSKACDPCESGKFGASAGVCTNCDAGRYEDSEGSVKCKECAKGQAQEEGGKIECKLCGTGTFANKTSLEQCYDCPKGYYVNDLGSASCFSCSPGKFTSSLGSLKCEPCPRGYLQDQPKKSFCDKVKPGKVVAEGGSASIQVPFGYKICDEQGDSCETTAPFEACAQGKYGKAPTPTNQCYDCEAGKSSSQGATRCQVWYVVNFFLFFFPSFFFFFLFVKLTLHYLSFFHFSSLVHSHSNYT